MTLRQPYWKRTMSKQFYIQDKQKLVDCSCEFGCDNCIEKGPSVVLSDRTMAIILINVFKLKEAPLDETPMNPVGIKSLISETDPSSLAFEGDVEEFDDHDLKLITIGRSAEDFTTYFQEIIAICDTAIMLNVPILFGAN